MTCQMDLPTELLQHILNLCDRSMHGVRGFRLVCKRWRDLEYGSADRPVVVNIPLSVCVGRDAIRRESQLTKLSALKRTLVVPRGLRMIYTVTVPCKNKIVLKRLARVFMPHPVAPDELFVLASKVQRTDRVGILALMTVMKDKVVSMEAAAMVLSKSFRYRDPAMSDAVIALWPKLSGKVPVSDWHTMCFWLKKTVASIRFEWAVDMVRSMLRSSCPIDNRIGCELLARMGNIVLAERECLSLHTVASADTGGIGIVALRRLMGAVLQMDPFPVDLAKENLVTLICDRLQWLDAEVSSVFLSSAMKVNPKLRPLFVERVPSLRGGELFGHSRLFLVGVIMQYQSPCLVPVYKEFVSMAMVAFCDATYEVNADTACMVRIILSYAVKSEHTVAFFGDNSGPAFLSKLRGVGLKRRHRRFIEVLRRLSAVCRDEAELALAV